MRNQYEIWLSSLDRNRGNCVFGDSSNILDVDSSKELVDKIAYRVYDKIKHDMNGDQVGIGILLDRNNYYLAAFFAVWKIGHYFVPLNKQWPEDHLEKIIGQAGIKYIITDVEVPGVVNINLSELELDKDADKNELIFKEYRNKADLAYVIFTSGSTGAQKGVMISQNAYLAYLDWVKSYFYDYQHCTNLLITAELTFDITMGDIAFGIVFSVGIQVSPDPRNIFWHLKLIKDRGIDVFYSVPTTIKNLYFWSLSKKKEELLSGLKLIIAGGESFTWDLYNTVMEASPKANFFNVYGPTEVTINCLAINLTKYRALHNDSLSIPIGKPFPHLSPKLLKNGEIYKGFEVGELLMSGVQNMSGYINDEDLTEKAFSLINNDYYYKTGDLVYVDDLENYFILGRTDSLVKVKGYRLNPMEVDNIIISLPSVTEVKTVVFSEKESSDQIISFIRPQASNSSGIEDQIISLCTKKLPHYMIPQRIILLDEMPLGKSGKYDVKSLKNKFLSESV